MRIEFCSSCGAPLDARWSEIVIVCRYCGSQSAPGDIGDPVPSSFPDDGRLRLAVAGRTYLALGMLGRGDSSYVYKGRWVRRLGEEVVLKVLGSSTDEDLLRREWSILERLHGSASRGSPHFAGLVPEPIAMARVKVGDRDRLTTVFKWRSGFYHTLEDVMRAHPKGVSPGSAVWILKRLLEVLSWAHRAGVVHSAVVPAHVLIHPLDHGAILVGWTVAAARAGTDGGRLLAISKTWRDWYSQEASREMRGGPQLDIAMAARCALRVAGAASFRDSGGLDSTLGELVVSAARGDHDDAWSLRERVSATSLEVLGQPGYSPISMPGWPSRRR